MQKARTRLTAQGPRSKNLPSKSNALSRCTWLNSTWKNKKKMVSLQTILVCNPETLLHELPALERSDHSSDLSAASVSYLELVLQRSDHSSDLSAASVT